MKFIALLILLMTQSALAADVLVTIDNSMMVPTSTSSGFIDLGTFDPFNPGVNCEEYISPNTCTPNGRDNVDIQLTFAYEVEILSGASSIDLTFSVDNGVGGSTGLFTNVSNPSPIFNLINNSAGTSELAFTIPLFGPMSRSDYGLNLTIDVTINP